MSVVYVATLALLSGVCSASPTSRIVEGTETTIESFPSAVQVDFFNPTTNTWSHNCGGNILNELYILSAAHCTDLLHDQHFSVENRRIRAGSTTRNSGGVIRNAASILNHPDYNVAMYVDADICIIRLAEWLTFGSAINNIAIPPQGFVIPDNAPVVHAGWGAVGWGQGASPVLLYVNQVHRGNCNDVPVTEYMVCANSPTNGTDGACSGDSGGPLYYGGVLAGVVSFTTAPCDVPGRMTVSGRVAAATNWIIENAI